MNKMVKNISKIFCLITLIIVIITFLTESSILYGFIALFISLCVGLIAEILNMKKKIIMIVYVILIILMLYISWVWISSDIVPTVVYLSK